MHSRSTELNIYSLPNSETKLITAHIKERRIRLLLF